MQCPHCLAEIPRDVLFCDKCGNKIDLNTAAGNEATESSMIPAGRQSNNEDDTAPLSVKDSLRRPLKDPDVMKKVLLGGLLGMIPFVGAIIQSGFICEYIQKIIHRQDSKRLPDWSDLVGLLSIGVWPFLAALIYNMIIMIPTGIVTVVSLGGFGAIFSIIKGAKSDPTAGLEACSALVIPMSVFFVLIMALSIIAPFIEIFYIKKRNFMDAFDVMGMFRLIMSNVSNYISISVWLFVLGIGAALVIGPLSVIPLGQILASLLMTFVSFGIRLAAMSAFSELYYQNHEKAGV